MGDTHAMQTIATGHEGWTLECPTCGKVLVIYRSPGRPPATVIEGNDPGALHSWSNAPGLTMAASPAGNSASPVEGGQ
jgi:hypothetical protein